MTHAWAMLARDCAPANAEVRNDSLRRRKRLKHPAYKGMILCRRGLIVATGTCAGLLPLRCATNRDVGRMESCAFVTRLFSRGRSSRHRRTPRASSDVVLRRLEQQDARL